MRIIVFLIFIALSMGLSAHNRYKERTFDVNRYGYIVKNNGDSIQGYVVMSDVNSVFKSKIILTKNDLKTVKINIDDIKFMIFGNDVFRIFSLDNLGKVFARVIDTSNFIKIFEGYSWQTIPTSIKFVGNIIKFRYSYILQVNNAEPVVIDEKQYVNTIPLVEIESNYKKWLKRYFTNNNKVVEYIDTLEEIEFDEIPKFISQINTSFYQAK